MKKTILLIGLMLSLLGCSISTPTSSFEQDVATRVALAVTETALQATVEGQIVTVTPIQSTEAIPTNTQTPPADDPKTTLGNPSFKDDLSSGASWSLDIGEVKEFGNTSFGLNNGKLTAKSQSTTSGFIWWLSYLGFKNAYLEAKFDVEQCSGNDQYGLIVRAADYGDGYAYYYTVTCSGNYDLRRRTATGSTQLLGMPTSDAINKGANQSNTLGIWLDKDVIRLYINNQFLTEINESSIAVDGHFGLFINAVQTPGFTIHLDEIAYWKLD